MDFSPNGSNLFQILISDEQQQDLELLPVLSANRSSFEALHPELRYSLLNSADIRSVIANHFENTVLAAYDALTPYAYKADLARYCLLYLFGGLYADLSMRLLVRLTLPFGKEILCFRDAYCNGGSTWSVSNGLIRATPRRPEFRCAIDLIVANHQNLYYGASLLHPTGPALLGRALALMDRGEVLEIGEFRNLTGTTQPLSYGYVDSVGRLVCIRMKDSGNDLGLLGVKGVNMYNTLWAERIIFSEPLIFNHDDKKLHIFQGTRDEKGIAITSDMHGWIIYGPYIYLPTGHYRGQYLFNQDFILAGLTLDVAAGAEILAEARIDQLDHNAAVTLDFRLERSWHNLEFRLSVHGGSSGRCLGLRIERASFC